MITTVLDAKGHGLDRCMRAVAGDVRLGCVPEWLEVALRCGHLYLAGAAGQECVERVLNPPLLHWCENWGSALLDDGRLAFVAHPANQELSALELLHIEAVVENLRDEFECEYWLDENGRDFAQRTIRVVIARKRADDPHRIVPIEDEQACRI